MSDGWSIVETEFRPEHGRAYEGLFTLGSGYVHVRGSLEEHLSDAPQNVEFTRLPTSVTTEAFRPAKAKWGTYVPGLFGRHPLLNNEMINLPWFLGIAPTVDGERLDVERGELSSYRRELRLDTATLNRTLRWRTASGVVVDIAFERFVSLVHPYLTVQRMKLSVDGPAKVAVESGIDADVRTNGYDHFAYVELGQASGTALVCFVHTDANEQLGVLTQVRPDDAPWRYEPGPRRANLVAEMELSGGSEWVVEKRTAVRTTRDLKPKNLVSCLTQLQDVPYDALHAEHVEAWRRRWETCDVVIEGDPASQMAMRVCLFHLLRTHVTDDPRVAIDAKGYAGEAYWGRFFWDTETFVLPFCLYTDPARARTMVEFRLQTLPGAKDNAGRYGYPGARYAWESDAKGHECCPNWQYADHEVHVTADVVYGLTHYARAVGGEEYLRGPAAEVAVETARYWLARLDRRPGDEHVSLLGVMGPDEYTPISSNNSYTNKLVAFALDIAAAVGESGGASTEEREAFARAGHALPLILNEEGDLVLQCEEFELLAEPRFEEFWRDRSRPFAAQVSQERLFRSKCLKQADVLMLMLLFPGDFSGEEVRRAWDYYLPYTTHDSSLSAGVHAILAARLGLVDQAWRFWQMGKGLDLDFERGGAAEGIHIAGAAAVWQMAVFGFAGMRTAMETDMLTLVPRLPAAWTRLRFPVVWHGCPVTVEVVPDHVTVTNRGESPLAVCVCDAQREVPPGDSVGWEVSA